MSFAELQKARKKALEKLQGEAEKISAGGKSFGDDRLWKPTIDKAGNGYAVIRLLPSPDVDETPWTRYWDHGFQGPTGKWYIERSLTSIGQDDPVSVSNSALWATGREEDKDTVRKRKRRLHYVSNILVVSDPANPSNDGKVFLFQYGKKIFDKIVDVMQPEFADEKPINPFDLWEGVNFKLKIRNVEGYRNYDKSEFDKTPTPASKDETRLKEIYDSLYSLKEFTDPKNYKSYAELEAKMIAVLGPEARKTTTRQAVDLDDEEPAPRPQREEASKATEPDADDDIDLAYFTRIAQDD